ncbi:MAG: NTP transferase domain-containing protein [Methanosarcinales archaeon]|nr:NTP transferase domain-containing protein [Methanosarcinales archaeon]
MKAVILAAGEGTRMRPLTKHCPKVMLPIGNKPLLQHVIEQVKDAGVDHFILVIGYQGDTIIEHFGEGERFGVKIDYVIQQERLGTAHAIGTARALIDKQFLVLNGDVMVTTSQVRTLLERDEVVVMAAMEVDDPSQFGVLEVDGGIVVKLHEKPENPPTNLANVGIYVFEPEVFKDIDNTPLSSREEYEITRTIQDMIDSGIHVGYQVLSGTWHDVGRPWDMLDANMEYLKTISNDIKGEIEDDVHIHGAVIIEAGARVRSGAYIEGPVIIGPDCDIGPNCYIRPYTSLGRGVRIGNAVEVKNSIIMDRTHVGHLSYVGDSVIGNGCNFGAGTKVAYLRHDGGNIKVMINGERIDSGRRKLGTIMSDDVHTGINSMLNVGSVIEPGSNIQPGEFVRDYYPNE